MMETHGLEVKLNGQPVCRAGFHADRYHLGCILHVVKHAELTSDQIELRVGGSEGPTPKLVSWVEQMLREGDTITLQIVTGNYDPPQSSQDTHLDLSQASSWLNQSVKEIKDLLDADQAPDSDENE
jgi:hypothetical protein